MEKKPYSLAVKLAVIAEYRSYLDRYQFPELFWIWLLGGVHGDGTTEFPTGAVGRDAPPEEAERQLAYFGELMIPQVRQQLHFHEAVPNVIRNPLSWGEHFIGKNKAHAGQLKKDELGLWAVRRVFVGLRTMVRDLESSWATMSLQQEPLPLFASALNTPSMKPPTSWPPNPRHCFPWKRLPIRRPWLLDASPTERDLWERDPAVMAAEVKAIGYMGRCVSTAAIHVKEELAPPAP